MITARLSADDDFDGWRDQCRGLLRIGARPEDVIWQVGEKATDLFADTPQQTPAVAPTIGVPQEFVNLARSVICHSDPARFSLLHQLLGDIKARRRRMDDAADPLLRSLHDMAKHVRRDIHKMRAFVRFRRVEQEDGEHFIAWFEPDHHIVRTNAAFFVRRFASMRWSILTPQLSIYWDKDRLHEGPPAKREDAPTEDLIEDQWKTYYGSIFNPARLKVKAMLKEMPKKYWHNMPETALISSLVQSARGREIAMIETEFTPSSAATTIEALHKEAKACRRCPLHGPATQIVFGKGSENAPLMFVGEQPGDQEDMQGRPFVGPAGQLFDAALAEAGVDRNRAYVTNAVKHFKFKPQGKRRIHERPNVGEINHCRWWLKREIELVQPELIVALGATAARSLIGRNIPITANRGQMFESVEGVPVLVTIHPSFLLRLPDAEQAQEERRKFVADLESAKERVSRFQLAAT
jgi:DNA polymerase